MIVSPPRVFRFSVALLGSALLLSAAATTAAVESAPALLPQPASIAMGRGQFPLDRPLRVSAPRDDAAAQAIAARLASDAQRLCGRSIAFEPRHSRAAALRLERSTHNRDGGDEAYRIDIDRRRVTLSAAHDAGLRHAATSLLQLLCTARADALPALRIEDAPQFGWRGVMLDSARHYQSPDFIRRFIDAMAWHKLNVLHWHLTDDQAWRLQIRKYPRLTEVGAWRVPAGEGPRRDIDPATGAPRLYGGYYTQDEVRALVAYAAERGITIVPEIEMPGHASAAIAAYPQLGADPQAVRGVVPADWGIYANAFALDEPTFAFLEDVLRETMELFPSQYLHVGGDEVEDAQWKRSAVGSALADRLGGSHGHALQAWFTERIARFVAANGRRLVGWDEILTPGLAPDAVVMSWRGIDGAVQAAARGHDTILSPWPTLYFDNRQSDALDEPPGRVRTISLKDVYAFDPLPASIAPDARRHVLGLQGNVWAEHIRTEARVAHMAFPRAAAVAELGWTPAAQRGWEGFVRRLDVLRPVYARLGIEAAGSAPDGVAPARTLDPDRRGSRELDLCSEDIALMLEDDAPREGTRAVFAVDIQQPCWRWPAAPLAGVSAIEVAVGQLPFNFRIGEARERITFPLPQTAEGELEVRVDGCDGELIARIPFARATRSQAVTRLPPMAITPRDGDRDLCLRFAQPGLDPFWVIDTIRLVRS